MSEERYAIHNSKSLVPFFDKIWENPVLTSDEECEAQVIDITDFNLSDYNLFIVEIVAWTQNRAQNFMSRAGVTSYASGFSENITISPIAMQFDNQGIFFATRSITIQRSNNTIVFGEGEKFINTNMGNPIADNKAAVPVCILGTKI